jgi:hypothetical protein
MFAMDCVNWVGLLLSYLRFCWKRLCIVALLGLVLNLGGFSVAQAQVQAQAQSPEDSLITPLIEKLTDRSPRMRLEAADALVAIGTPASSFYASELAHLLV